MRKNLIRVAAQDMLDRVGDLLKIADLLLPDIPRAEFEVDRVQADAPEPLAQAVVVADFVQRVVALEVLEGWSAQGPLDVVFRSVVGVDVILLARNAYAEFGQGEIEPEAAAVTIAVAIAIMVPVREFIVDQYDFTPVAIPFDAAQEVAVFTLNGDDLDPVGTFDDRAVPPSLYPFDVDVARRSPQTFGLIVPDDDFAIIPFDAAIARLLDDDAPIRLLTLVPLARHVLQFFPRKFDALLAALLLFVTRDDTVTQTILRVDIAVAQLLFRAALVVFGRSVAPEAQILPLALPGTLSLALVLSLTLLLKLAPPEVLLALKLLPLSLIAALALTLVLKLAPPEVLLALKLLPLSLTAALALTLFLKLTPPELLLTLQLLALTAALALTLTLFLKLAPPELLLALKLLTLSLATALTLTLLLKLAPPELLLTLQLLALTAALSLTLLLKLAPPELLLTLQLLTLSLAAALSLTLLLKLAPPKVFLTLVLLALSLAAALALVLALLLTPTVTIFPLALMFLALALATALALQFAPMRATLSALTLILLTLALAAALLLLSLALAALLFVFGFIRLVLSDHHPRFVAGPGFGFQPARRGGNPHRRSYKKNCVLRPYYGHFLAFR